MKVLDDPYAERSASRRRGWVAALLIGGLLFACGESQPSDQQSKAETQAPRPLVLEPPVHPRLQEPPPTLEDFEDPFPEALDLNGEPAVVIARLEQALGDAHVRLGALVAFHQRFSRSPRLKIEQIHPTLIARQERMAARIADIEAELDHQRSR